MYELGLAHALRPAQELVVVRSDHEEINFDIAGIKIQHYDSSDLPQARAKFAQLLSNALKEIDQIKHLKVTEAVESLDADTHVLLGNTGKRDDLSVRIPRTKGDAMDDIAFGIKDSVRHLLSLGIVRFDAKLSGNS
jgi:hypothetical protein